MATPRESSSTDDRPKWKRRAGVSTRSSRGAGYKIANFARAYRSWIVPYLRSCLHADEFHPVLSFLYTDLNCNLDCHYCYSRGRKIPGMTLEVGRACVDWLHSAGCRELPPWPCCAGKYTMIIRLDGSFAPCFELYASQEDWGSIYEGPRFDVTRLKEIKGRCTPHCLSTCNFQVNHYTRSFLYSLQWVAKHAQARFFGAS